MTRTTSPRPRRRARSAPASPGRWCSGAIGTASSSLFRAADRRRPARRPRGREPGASGPGSWPGVWLVFKIADITLWLERRPGAFLIADTPRPLLGLIALVAPARDRLRGRGRDPRHGDRHRDAPRSWRWSCCAAAIEPSFDLGEVKQIIIRGGPPRADRDVVLAGPERRHLHPLALRRPTPSSASTRSPRGSASSSPSCPRAFAMAMRPLRKSAAFQALRDQYGKPTAQGQLLGYFVLLCILAVLVMILVRRGPRRRAPPDAYADAAGADPVHRGRLRHAVALPDREPERRTSRTSGPCSSAAASAARWPSSGSRRRSLPRSASTRRRSGCWSASASRRR